MLKAKGDEDSPPPATRVPSLVAEGVWLPPWPLELPTLEPPTGELVMSARDSDERMSLARRLLEWDDEPLLEHTRVNVHRVRKRGIGQKSSTL